MEATGHRALVTGASSGLGVEFAQALAARGLDLILTARRGDRLESLAGELRRQHGVKVEVLIADLADTDGPLRLFDAVQSTGLTVNALVNNAGFGHFGPMLGQSLNQINSMIAVNVTALTMLTRLFAEKMRQQGSGRILQVASYAGLQPIPRYAVYSAAKAYVVALTQSLRHELRKSGVTVSVVAPGFMATEFHDVANHVKSRAMKLTSLSAEYVARRAIDGMFKGKLLITPGVVYQVNNCLLRLLPRQTASAISAAIVKS